MYRNKMLLAAQILSFFPLAFSLIMWYNEQKEAGIMEWYDFLITALGVAVPVVIAILAERGSIKKLDEHLGFDNSEQSLAKKLGVGEKSITSLLGVNERSITSQIGVGENDLSLSLQHSEIKEAIIEKISDQTAKIDIQTSEINAIARKIHDEEVRRGLLTNEQQGLLHTVNALVLDWELSHQKLSGLENELRNCNEKISELESENELLRQELETYRPSNESDSTEDWEQ